MKLTVFLLLISTVIDISWECHSLSNQYTKYSSRRARARGTNLLERDNENAIGFDQLTSNLPFSANDIRSMSSMHPFPNKPQLSVADGGKLTCFFDDEMEYCGWHNAQETDLKFWRAKLEPSFDARLLENSITNSFTADKYFLLAGGDPASSSQTAAIETEIPCQYGDAEIQFDFWTNKPNVMVRYCITNKFNFDCQMIPRNVNPLNFSIPTTADELKVRIEFMYFDADSIVLIDNLHYNGQICEIIDDVTEHESTLSSLEPINAPSSSETPILITGVPIPIESNLKVKKFFEEENISNEETTNETRNQSDVQFKELSPCSALSCTFNDGDSCFYGLTGPGSTASWSLSDSLVGNRHTGIQRVNLADQTKVGFIYVGNDVNSETENTFVVESPTFSVDSDSLLVFDVYIRSISVRLKVCINDFDTCPYESPVVDPKLFWHENQKVFLSSGSKKIFFIMENVKKHQFLAIDNIRLESENGSSLC